MLLPRVKTKKFWTVILVGTLMLTMVNAGLMLYYAQITANIVVTQPITVTGNLKYTIENAMSGNTVKTGEGDIAIWNSADFPIDVKISNDAPEGLNVIYEYIICPYIGVCSYPQILEGNTITIPKKDDGFISMDISYELNNMLETGTYTITTTIDQSE